MNRSILIAALIISGAILLNGYFDRVALPPHFNLPSTSKVKKTVVAALTSTFDASKGYVTIMNKKRDVNDIQINDIRYSEGGDRMLIEMTLACSDGDKVTSSFVLNRDDFGAYRGLWDFGTQKAFIGIE